MEDNRTLADLAKEALSVQDACNLSGVIHGWSRASRRLRELLPDLDSRGFEAHSITALWADKIRDMTEYGRTMDLVEAMNWCENTKS